VKSVVVDQVWEPHQETQMSALTALGGVFVGRPELVEGGEGLVDSPTKASAGSINGYIVSPFAVASSLPIHEENPS
jgi:hypothetical protein